MKYLTQVAVGMLALAASLPGFGADVVSIWGGARGTVVKKSDGTVWTWGANFGGKLGVGISSTNLSRVLAPGEVHGFGDVGFLNAVTAIMGGEMHNVAIRTGRFGPGGSIPWVRWEMARRITASTLCR
jgi:hypothetical protein